MACFNQERKAKLAPAIKAIQKKYKIKGSLAVRNHSSFVLNIKSGAIDFIGNYNNTVAAQPGGFCNGNSAEKSLHVNPHWYQELFDGRALNFLKEIFAAMNLGNHDRSDIQSDYFDVGWYVDVNVGAWNQPYELTK